MKGTFVNTKSYYLLTKEITFETDDLVITELSSADSLCDIIMKYVASFII